MIGKLLLLVCICSSSILPLKAREILNKDISKTREKRLSIIRPWLPPPPTASRCLGLELILCEGPLTCEEQVTMFNYVPAANGYCMGCTVCGTERCEAQGGQAVEFGANIIHCFVYKSPPHSSG